MAAEGTSRALSAFIVVCTVGVFVLDTVTPPEFAISVLYVGVVLLAARVFERRGIVLAATGCAALAIFSFWMPQPQAEPTIAVANHILSLAAIAVTAFLGVQSRSRERVLREQAGLLDLSHDTIFVRDADDVITYWNRGAEELYGWSKGEAIGHVSHQLMRTVFPVPLEEIMAQLHRADRWEGELLHTKKDGTHAVVASRWSVQRDAHGHLTSVLETNNDITNRKRAEDALRQAQAELAHVTRVTTMNVLTSSIAHEVNQPLSGIITNAHAGLRWLAREPPELERARQTLQRIVRDGQRAGEVIGRVRALLRKTETQREPLSMGDLIQDTVSLVHGEVVRHRILLRTDLTPGLPPVLGDRVQLQQVLLNLTLNGIDAMKDTPGKPRDLLIKSEPDGPGTVMVSVRDTGVGMDPQDVERVFDAFYTTKPDGMGMGLAICRWIVAGHDGRLWASVDEPGSTVFHFTLPARQETAGSPVDTT